MVDGPPFPLLLSAPSFGILRDFWPYSKYLKKDSC